MTGEEVLARAETLEAEGQYQAAVEQMALLFGDGALSVDTPGPKREITIYRAKLMALTGDVEAATQTTDIAMTSYCVSEDLRANIDRQALVNDCQALRELLPEHPVPAFLLGWALSELARPDEALAAFASCSEILGRGQWKSFLEPLWGAAYLERDMHRQRADIHFRRMEWLQVVIEAAAVLHSEPESAYRLLQVTIALFEMGREPDAEPYVVRWTRVQPDMAAPWVYRAMIEGALQSPCLPDTLGRAYSLVSRDVAEGAEEWKGPDLREYLSAVVFNYSLGLAKGGDIAGAKPWVECAAWLTPEDEQVQELLQAVS